jgi:hypothetical protein
VGSDIVRRHADATEHVLAGRVHRVSTAPFRAAVCVSCRARCGVVRFCGDARLATVVGVRDLARDGRITL